MLNNKSKILFLFCIFFITYSFSQDLENDKINYIGNDIQIFISTDDLNKIKGASLKLNSPVRKEIVYELNKPYEGKQSGYALIFRDGGEIKLYYRGGGDLTREYLCLALSIDGINFTRPELNLIEFEGNKKNNIVYTSKLPSYMECHNFTPFIDSKPGIPNEQKYKAVGLGRHPDENRKQRKVLCGFVSSDGLHWNKVREEHILEDGSFDSQNIVFWDTNYKKYVCYFRIGREGIRSIARSDSDDFVNWSKTIPLDFKNTLLEHFYTNAIIQYPRNSKYYFGFPMRFNPERKNIGYPSRETDGLSDAVIITSKDGFVWDRTFMEAFIRPDINQNNWGEAHCNITPIWGIIQTSDYEYSIYWFENYIDVPSIRRGAIRLDGFTSIHTGYNEGECITNLINFQGSKLYINFSTSAVGYIKIEILDEKMIPLKNYTLENSEELYGDEIERQVNWKGTKDLKELEGKNIYLRFVMKDADLFSYRFK